MNRAEAVELLTGRTSVTVRQAAAALGVSDRTAYRNAQRDDQVAPGVPVIKITDRRWLVPAAAVLRVLQLEGSPLGHHTRLTQGGTTEGGPRLGPPSVTVPNNHLAKGEVRVNHSNRPHLA
jgi:hypothetical protein